MKKKFALWLNLITICLCVCIIAIGVYSAQNAKLIVSGSVGFKAHNCDVDVTGYMWGDSVEIDDKNSPSKADGSTVRSKTNKKTIGTQSLNGNTKSFDLGNMYFGDMTNDGSIAPIVLEFSLSNKSAFAIDAEIIDVSIKTGTVNYSNIKYTKSEDVEIDSNQSGVLTLTLTLNVDDSITLGTLPKVSFTISMYKHTPKATISTSWNTSSGGIFDNSKKPFGTSINLTTSTINSLSFLRELPNDITTYTKADNLSLNSTTTGETSIINAYAKESTNNSGYYDVIIHSKGKIKPTSCKNMYSNLSVKSIDLSNLDTSEVTDMSNMFYECRDITNINVGGLNTTNVENMSNMFYLCRSLTSLDLSNFDTSKVTNMSGMFEECENLSNLDLSSFDTSKVKDMSAMFLMCPYVNTFNISSFNTCAVTDMQSMFYWSGFSSLDLTHFDTRELIDMSNMFEGCSNLQSLDLSSFNTSKVTNMSSLFKQCYSIRTIYVGDKWNMNAVNSSSEMFGECSNLVGGNGTEFNNAHTDKTYARIDSVGTPGYLTNISQKTN